MYEGLTNTSLMQVRKASPTPCLSDCIMSIVHIPEIFRE